MSFSFSKKLVRRKTNKFMNNTCWRGARVVEPDGLENRCAGNRTVGSNPTLSAKNRFSGYPVSSSSVFLPDNRKLRNRSSGEMSELAEGARLEIVWPPKASRGFESPSLRHKISWPPTEIGLAVLDGEVAVPCTRNPL